MSGNYLTDQDMVDLGLATQREQGRMRFELIAENYQDYIIMRHFLEQNRMVITGGKGIQRNLMDRIPDAASHVGLMDQYTYNIEDLLAQIQVNWVMARSHWSYGKVEVAENSNAGENQIADMLKARRVGAALSMVEELEKKGAVKPATSADVKNPWGLTYWIVQNATKGFNGGLPSGHSTLAGLDLTAHANFKNYTDTYSDVSESGLFVKLREALMKMRYRTPVTVQDYARGPGEAQRVFVRMDTLLAMQTYTKGSGDAAGLSVGGSDFNTLLMNRIPVEWWPYLDDADTGNVYPIYCIDFNHFSMAILSGFDMTEEEPRKSTDNPLWFNCDTHLRYNFLCTNRKKQAVLYLA